MIKHINMLKYFSVALMAFILVIISLEHYKEHNNYAGRVKSALQLLVNTRPIDNTFDALNSNNQQLNLDNYVVNTASLNVRTGPSIQASVSRVLHLGTIVQPLQKLDNWVKVDQNSWTSATYLSKIDSIELVERNLYWIDGSSEIRTRIVIYLTTEKIFRARLEYLDIGESSILWGQSINDNNRTNAVEYKVSQAPLKSRKYSDFEISTKALIAGGNAAIGYLKRDNGRKKLKIFSRK